MDAISSLERLGWKLRFDDDSVPEGMRYSLKRVGPGASNRLVGVEAFTLGRFGNAVFINLHAIDVALLLGVDHVRLCDQEGFRATRVEWNGLDIFTEEWPSLDGLVLQGPFIDLINMPGRTRPTLEQRRKLAINVIRQFVALSATDRNPAPNELAIHLRAGDIFEDGKAHPSYAQPPLAFYKRLLKETVRQHGIEKLAIVYENTRNPCVEPLIAHVKETGWAFTVQSSSLADDVAALIDCHHVAFGHGTFMPAVSLMNPHVESVRCFSNNKAHAGLRYRWVGNRYNFFDARGDYIGLDAWANTDEQRRLMLEYPEEALGIAE